MSIMQSEEMKELSPCTLHGRKLCWVKEDEAEPVGKIRGTCTSKWNSQKAMNHSREGRSNSLLFTHSMYSERKCYFLNAASPSTSAMNYTEHYAVKKLASILIWYKDITINSSVWTTLFFPAKNFHAVFFPTQPKATDFGSMPSQQSAIPRNLITMAAMSIKPWKEPEKLLYNLIQKEMFPRLKCFPLAL